MKTKLSGLFLLGALLATSAFADSLKTSSAEVDGGCYCSGDRLDADLVINGYVAQSFGCPHVDGNFWCSALRKCERAKRSEGC